ncbi:gag-pol, partial [Mucuna pruriens]
MDYQPAVLNRIHVCYPCPGLGGVYSDHPSPFNDSFHHRGEVCSSERHSLVMFYTPIPPLPTSQGGLKEVKEKIMLAHASRGADGVTRHSHAYSAPYPASLFAHPALSAPGRIKDIVMIKSFTGAFRISRSSLSSNFAMQHLGAAIMDPLRLPEKCLILGSIGPPFSRCLLISHIPSTTQANEMFIVQDVARRLNLAKTLSEPNSPSSNTGSTQVADSEPYEKDMLRTSRPAPTISKYVAHKERLQEDRDSRRRLSVGIFWKLFVSSESEAEAIEVIDRYNRHVLVEGILKAWTNSGEPPQSPPWSLSAKEAESHHDKSELITYQLVSIYEQCQKQPILFYEVFDIWGIDFMEPFSVFNGYSYILLVVDYVSRWVEAIATKTNDAKIVVYFLKFNIFYQFGVPKAPISEQESHFCNRAMSALLHKYVMPTTPRQIAKLKYSTRKSRKHYKRWLILARRIGADSLRIHYGHRTAY